VQNTNKLLSITNLKKYFPIAKSNIFQRNQLYVRANEEITIDIYQGETFGLVGESGCGKSTLGRTILQLYDQTAGSTIYYGMTLAEFAPAYVKKTLKNATKMIAAYQKLQAKAAQLTEECEQLGDAATFFQHQKKNLTVAEAETAFQNVVKILGGFAALIAVVSGVIFEIQHVHVGTAATPQGVFHHAGGGLATGLADGGHLDLHGLCLGHHLAS
jgi:peptide/nickel transport system ATP-binding protein